MQLNQSSFTSLPQRRRQKSWKEHEFLERQNVAKRDELSQIRSEFDFHTEFVASNSDSELSGKERDGNRGLKGYIKEEGKSWSAIKYNSGSKWGPKHLCSQYSRNRILGNFIIKKNLTEMTFVFNDNSVFS